MTAFRGPISALILAASFPVAASAPDTEAVEFYNSAIGHYFITATALEVRGIALGAAGEGWVRTGRSFRAWLDNSTAPADARPVCRFYSPGANSHFYTANDGECQTLKDLEAAERSRGGEVRGWTYEGIAFYVQAPTLQGCPAGTVPIGRSYNDGIATGEGSNHRFMDDDDLKALMAARGWIIEGTAFCAVPKPTGTNAELAATTTAFDALVGTWRGDARWEVDNRGRDSRRSAPLELTLAADGTISGAGSGCTFAGRVASGDGFRSLFRATIAASGCSDASFNGTYRPLYLERYGAGTLMVEMKRGEGADEASIEAQLTSGAATPTLPAGSFAAIAGDWVGTVGWIARSATKDSDRTRTAVNRSLALAVSPAGALSGNGYGCALSGSLGLPFGGESSFRGTLTASGCENASFNGLYAHAKVGRDRGARLEIDFKRESSEGSEHDYEEIEGSLYAAGGVAVDIPPVGIAGSHLAGTWEGAAAWSVTQGDDDHDRALNSVFGRLRLSIADNGTVSGSGNGCTFTGQVALRSDGDKVDYGTVTATGCADPAFNGLYRKVDMERDDGGTLDVELEQDAEGSGSRLHVRVKGRLARAS